MALLKISVQMNSCYKVYDDFAGFFEIDNSRDATGSYSISLDWYGSSN